ncbi:elongation factor 1-beta [Candidatus Woesearchaeota archaeon]|nr:elongation factor 1-beta [Candidatus Woesearchaeota archaeon]
MARVVVSMKVMPESPDINLDDLTKEILKKVKNFAGNTETKVQKEPIGFGLNSLKVQFVLDEQKSNLDPLESSIKNIDGVSSVEIIDVRRAIG